MPRPIDMKAEETSYDEAAMKEYIAGQSALEEGAASVHCTYKERVADIEKHRKAFQADKRLNTEAIDAVRKLVNSKSPSKRLAFLRTFDIARRLLGADDQLDMFPDHIDPKEADAIATSTA